MPNRTRTFRIAFYKTGRETVAWQLLENMLQPARPYVEFSRARFHRRAMRALRWAKEPLKPKGRNSAGPVYYSLQKRVSGSLDNCHVSVQGDGSNLGGPNLRTAELAQQVADIVRQSRGKKWGP